MIDEVYCINIRKRPDRLEQFKESLLDGKINRIIPKVEMTTDWEKNLDAEKITDKWLKDNNMGMFDWQIESDNTWWNRPLKRGELGCTISHTEIWKKAKGYTLILEDDIIFYNNWLSKLYISLNHLNKIDAKWDLLYLGRAAQNPENEKQIDEIIVKPDYTYCTYAYMLSPKGIEKILKYEVEKCIIPADEFLTATYNTHPRKDVRLKYPPTLSAYAVNPCIIGQRNKDESGSDTEASEFV
tara:strand:+ start:741 stop:1463 length:723 start_codon:yes stop_codon:yes gene_type:complete